MKGQRHVVLLSFYDICTPAEIKKVENGFNALKSKIPEIKGYEWGINNSPEKKNKGFTHAYHLEFDNPASRDKYLKHPAHQAFLKLMAPYVSDALVIGYLAR